MKRISLDTDIELRAAAAKRHAGGAAPTSIWTDGACSKNGRAGARGGVGVFFGEGDPRNISRPLPGPPTNNRAELYAIQCAFEAVLAEPARYRGHVTLFTDSELCVNSLNKWLPGWRARNWRRPSRRKGEPGPPVLNADLLDVVDRLRTQLRYEHDIAVDIRWVKAHASNAGNNAADRLAVRGRSSA